MTPVRTARNTDDPLSPDQSPVLLQHQRVALGALLLLLSATGPLVTLGLYLREGTSGLMWVGASLSSVIWLALVVFHLGRIRLAAHLVIVAVLLASVVGTLVHGTVRSSAVLVMLAGLVAAGSFLPRTTLIVAAVLCAIALAVMNWMENKGHLPTPNLETGWAVWIAQVSILASMLVSAFYGRLRLMESFLDQEKALHRAQEAQIELQASQERLEALFRDNPAACLVQSVSTRQILDANDSFCKLFGYRRDELEGGGSRNFWAIGEERSAFRTALQSQGRVNGMNAVAVRSDDSRFESVVHAKLVKHGNEDLLVAMVVDVSAEQASRRELEKSHERFTRAFLHSPICMTLTRLADGRYLEVNAACDRVLGGRPEDYIGKTSLETGVWLNPQVRADYVNTMRRDGRLQAYDTQIQNRQGEAVDVRVWAEIIDIDDEPCALTFVLNVAEERRRRAMLLETARGVSGETGKAFFRSLVTHMAQTLEANLVIAGEINKPGSVQTVAAYFDGRIVPNIEYDLEGTPCSHAFRVPGGQCFYAEHLAERFPTDNFPIGSEFETYVGVALRDADGTPIGILKALWVRHQPLSQDLQALLTIFSSRCNAELIRLRRDREIERLHETLEQRVQARTAQLEYVNRELDAFAYSVSHDLKSPLRSIDGFMHILHEQMSDRLTGEDGALISKVSASVNRMHGLITDLLSLARVSQGQLQRMQVDLTDLAEGVIRQERHRDPTHPVEVFIEPGLSADCDPRLAQIVLENLLGNAWKYSHQQASPRIELVRAAGDDTSTLTFIVRDNGAGFDMSRADRLFKPFNRLHSANEFEGSGIGLATVRRIIERHGGHIAGEGLVGQGSTFRFSFGNASAD
jgi:PAS domain S-box-containing protein